MRKKLLVATCSLLGLMIGPAAWAQSHGEDAPGDGKHLQRKLTAQKKAPTKMPVTTTCTLSTPDFVVTGSESTVSGDEHCFPNNAGVFGPRANIPGLTFVDGMDVADFDNDGDNDFLACDGLTGVVSLYTQGPPNTFVPTTVATGVTTGVSGSLFCTNLREADFNNDGLTDFVVGDNRVTNGMFVYLQGPVGTFTPVGAGLNVTWAAPTGVPCNCLFGVAAGDVDGDGNDDVVVLGYRGAGTGQVYFYQGNGTGAMAAPALLFNVSTAFPVVANPTGLALFDLEGDGDLDLAVGGSFDGSHYVYTNDGLGNFTAPAASAFTTNNWSGIDGFDANGDNNEDLVLVDWSSLRLLLTQNLGGALAAPAAAGVVDGPSIGIGAPARVEEDGFDLDHFKCYRAQADRPVEDEVILSDQFGDGFARVFETERFCNPVEKRHDNVVTPIQDPDAHLELLRIEAEPVPPVTVEVNNQFGREQKLDVGPAIYLAVPTQKIEPNNHPFPQRLDHFKCYEVNGEFQPVTVALRDQFGFEPEVKSLDPRLLCNPTKKVHNNTTTPIQNPLDHLVCYQLENTEPLFDFAFIRNQFGERFLQLDRADLLCLPSEKRVL